MKGALYFIAGVLVGLGSGYLIGKRRKNKNKEPEKMVTTYHVEEDEKDEGRRRHVESTEEEVEHVARKSGYISKEEDEEYVDYDQEDIQNDLDDIDDYLSELEHPEDDEPVVRDDFVKIADDQFYTERHDFDKIKLVLDADGSQLMDGIGNDYIDLFAEHGLSAEQLMKDAIQNGYTVYYRNDKLESDYEVLYEGGE